MRALCILSCLTPRLKGVRKVLIINGGILVNGGINGGMLERHLALDFSSRLLDFNFNELSSLLRSGRDS